jgi:hypothetical protein
VENISNDLRNKLENKMAYVNKKNREVEATIDEVATTMKELLKSVNQMKNLMSEQAVVAHQSLLAGLVPFEYDWQIVKFFAYDSRRDDRLAALWEHVRTEGEIKGYKFGTQIVRILLTDQYRLFHYWPSDL